MKMGRSFALNLSVLVTSATLLAACGADTGDAGQAPPVAGEQPNVTNDPFATPTPVAALEMPNGNRVEFYDFDTMALISQTGIAGTAPSLNLDHQPRHDELSAIWRSLAPNQPVPPALVELEQRLAKQPPSAQTAEPVITVDGAPEVPPEIDPNGDLLAVQSGCNNRCCDYDWLSTLNYCKNRGDYNLFHFNYAWSSLRSTGVVGHYSLACAAETSQYTVSVSSGKGGSWPVFPGAYRTYDWSAGTTCNPFCHYDEKTVNVSVNNSSSPHLHSLCVNVYH
jgi:hypothetical protein